MLITCNLAPLERFAQDQSCEPLNSIWSQYCVPAALAARNDEAYDAGFMLEFGYMMDALPRAHAVQLCDDAASVTASVEARALIDDINGCHKFACHAFKRYVMYWRISWHVCCHLLQRSSHV